MKYAFSTIPIYSILLLSCKVDDSNDVERLDSSLEQLELNRIKYEGYVKENKKKLKEIKVIQEEYNNKYSYMISDSVSLEARMDILNTVDFFQKEITKGNIDSAMSYVDIDHLGLEKTKAWKDIFVFTYNICESSSKFAHSDYTGFSKEIEYNCNEIISVVYFNEEDTLCYRLKKGNTGMKIIGISYLDSLENQINN
jgi:hypothetical protein